MTFAVAILLVPVLAAALMPAAEAAKVTTAPGTLPSPRVGAAAVHVGDGIVYTFGGRSGADYLDEIVRYDSNTGRSTVVASLPKPVDPLIQAGRQAMPAVYTGSKVYVFGGAALRNAGDLNQDGKDDFVPASIPDIVEFDPATNEAKRLTLDKLPSGAWGSSAVWFDGKAYIFGGFTFDIAQPDQITRRAWILTFDPTKPSGQRVKEESANLPFPNQDMSAALYENRVYLFGGLGDHNPSANPCPQVETENGTVTQNVCMSTTIIEMNLRQLAPQVLSAALPNRNQFSAAATIGSTIYVFGGRATDGSSFSTIQSFDPQEKTIETIFPKLPGGRYGMPAVVHGEDVLLMGGRDASEQFKHGMDDVLRFHSGATEPWAPRNLKASPVADGSGVALTWEPPLYDGGSAISHYSIYRTGADGVQTKIAEASGLTYKDADAAPGATYEYRVKTVNAFGETPEGAWVDTRATTRPPSAPLGFQAFPGNGYALLRWLPPADDGGSDVGGYRIYRGSDSRPLAEVGADVREYKDETAENGKTYEYRVAAFNGKGTGASTPVERVTPAAVPESPANVVVEEAGQALRIAWDAAAGDVVGYRIYRGTEPDHLSLLTEDAVTGTEYTDTAVVSGRLYYYAVAAENVNGAGAWSQVTAGGLLKPPSAPRNLLLTPGPGFINLSWFKPEDFGGAETVTYLVKRTDPGGQERIIGRGVTTTKYSDRQVIPGIEYTYRVQAVNGRFGPDSDAKTASAIEPTNEPPVAKLSVLGETKIEVNDEVSFDASLSTDPDGRIASYVFDWGDGTKPTESSTPQASHPYKRDGCFTVSLVVVDDRGARSAPATMPINVGSCGKDKDDDTNLGGEDFNVEGKDVTPPGSKTGGIPGFTGLAGLVALGVAVALVGYRRR